MSYLIVSWDNVGFAVVLIFGPVDSTFTRDALRIFGPRGCPNGDSWEGQQGHNAHEHARLQ